MFLNLSHHPSSFWSEAQRAAAQSIGGEIADECFPDVPPDASADDIRRMAGELVEIVVHRQPLAVMVEGEFTLSFCTVTALIAKGIPCYAAATRRVVREEFDGASTKRSSTFEFVRFRPYIVA